MESLYGLRLAGNSIAHLANETFSKCRGITMLNLADNKISKIEQMAFMPLKKLKVRRERDGNVNL